MAAKSKPTMANLFDLNQPAPSESEAVATADLLRNKEPSLCDGRPPPPSPRHAAVLLAPPPSTDLTLAPATHQRQGQRGRRSDSLDLDSPAPQRRGVFGSIQPHPSSERKPPHSSSSAGSNTMESRTLPLHPSASGAIGITCICGAESRPTIELIANGGELKDETEVECPWCGKKYVITLMPQTIDDE